MTRTLIAAAALTLAVAAPQAQAGIVIDYANFLGACGDGTLTCVGRAQSPGTDLQMTTNPGNVSGPGAPAAAYSTTAISLGAGATFSTSFQFRMGQAGGIAPADGITFVLSKATDGLGGGGGDIGYGGVANSIAIEFDTYDNGEAGHSNHVGLDVNGSLNSLTWANPYGVAYCDFGVGYTGDGCMSNGKVWSAFINYDGSTKKLNVSVQQQGLALIQLITDYTIDIASNLGTNNAYVGFTAATGAGWEKHDLLNWRLANDTSIGTGGNELPEPASLPLLSIAGLTALAARRRRPG